jgi:aldehyde dehydrogenase (NAD+)
MNEFKRSTLSLLTNFGFTGGGNFVNGKFHYRDDFANVNPSNEELLGYFPESTFFEVDGAVTVARIAFKSWQQMSRLRRADLFFKLATLIERDQQTLAHIISIETGKNLNESNAEVVEALHMCQWTAGFGRVAVGDWMASEIAAKDAYVMRKPKGVVAVISPWNFPLAIGSFWTTGPALIEGNCVVHKPSELTPYIAQKVAGLYREAGFPDGVYNVVHGSGKTGENLVRHPGVDCILFTGSAEVGQKIRQECANGFHKSCSTETGSKSATILFEDGNQDLALEVMTASAFKLTGQRCVSSGRLLIQQSIFDSFIDRFVDHVKSKITVGGPFDDPVPYCGPLISREQQLRVERYNNMVTDSPAVTMLLGGGRPNRPGFFLTPTVYTTTLTTTRLMFTRTTICSSAIPTSARR